jgi:hypothetical protein
VGACATRIDASPAERHDPFPGQARNAGVDESQDEALIGEGVRFELGQLEFRE